MLQKNICINSLTNRKCKTFMSSELRNFNPNRVQADILPCRTSRGITRV